MKNYQKPEFYFEEFMANEYVAACNVEGEIYGPDCGEYEFTGSLDTETDTISSVMVNDQGAWTGVMYQVTGGSRKGEWAYTGSIYDDNHKVGNYTMANGKFSNDSNPPFPVTHCDCEFKVVAQHHHVGVNITGGNRS